jgi:hypothetical protein
MSRPLIRLALRAIHLLPQAGEVRSTSPRPLAGKDALRSKAGEGRAS